MNDYPKTSHDRIFEEKSALRSKYKKLRAEIPTDIKKEADRAICEKIASLPSFALADTVLMYFPVGSEVDVTPIARMALAMNKKIAYPICDTVSCTMTFRYVSKLSELRCGSYNIKEPPQSAESITDKSAENLLCIVPALAFDARGFRLGYGKGYYDKFLEGFGGASVGVVYELNLTDKLPSDSFDIPVRIIITERRSVRTDAAEKKRKKEL